MPIMEAITAVSTAIDVAKAMRVAEKNFDAAAFKVQIADLMTALSDARIELLEAREATAAQAAEFDRLVLTLSRQGELVQANGGFKYMATADGKPSGLPICPSCEQRDGRTTFTVTDGVVRRVRCPVCDKRFEGVTVYAQRPADEPPTLEQQERAISADTNAAFHRKLRDYGSELG